MSIANSLYRIACIKAEIRKMEVKQATAKNFHDYELASLDLDSLERDLEWEQCEIQYARLNIRA